ncbi:MAG: EAL domain-containing protein [Eubacteriales bacterium]|nr:EAL domain-containing protein [Eubacteriales bacterium]
MGETIREADMEILDSKELMEQYQRLQEKASKDSLTGLLNRGAVERYVRQRLSTMGPEDSCALLIVDLDRFKNVNDSMGHQAGDAVLRRSARILSGLFRATDIVGRLGGDEFVAFLGGRINEEICQKKGEAICEHLQLTMEDGSGLTVTASVGICLSRGGERSFEDLYRLADEALYESKRGGRRRYRIKLDAHEKIPAQARDYGVSTIRLTQILEYMDSGVALLEPNEGLSVIYMSPGLRRTMGLEKMDCADMNFRRMVFREDSHVFSRMVKKAMAGGEVNQSVRLLRPEGKRIWCRIRIAEVDYEENRRALMLAVTDISDLKEKERVLKRKNERLQAAFDQTGQGIWEVDLSAGMFRMMGNDGIFAAQGKGWIEFPEGLLSSGWVHKESEQLLREFAGEMYAGKVKGYGNFILLYRESGTYGWATLSYSTIFDDQGRAVRAVGIVENLGHKNAALPRRPHLQRQIPEPQLPYLVLGLKADLTGDRVEEIWNEGKNRMGNPEWKDYASILQRGASRFFSKTDSQKFLKTFDRETLLAAFERGEYWHMMEYQRVDGSGDIQWVMLSANLYQDRKTGTVRLFATARRIQQRRGWEKALKVEIVRDPVTKLYSRGTFRTMVEMLMNKRESSGCGMALIHVGGPLSIYGQDLVRADRLRYYIVTALGTALDPICIMGQHSEDKILVFFPHIGSEDQFREILKSAFEYVRSVLEDTVDVERLRFIAGAVWGTARDSSYERMLHAAKQLCESWWNAAYDKVVFPEESEDWRWQELKRDTENDQMCTPVQEMERPLTEAEKDVALGCVSAMLMSDSLEYSQQTVLSYLGDFYKADRTYLLKLSGDKGTVTMPCEWTTAGKHSIQQLIFGLAVGRLPILEKCLLKKCPLFLTRDIVQEDKRKTAWRFMIFPMTENGQIDSFLCVENARENHMEAALPSYLIPHLLREKDRDYRVGMKHRDNRGKGVLGKHEDLPNLRSYMEMIHEFTSENYSSLGALCLDIPNLPTMNSNYGYEYGNRLLWYVTNTIENIFGADKLFRTWEAEFVVLCPNTTQEVFAGRSSRLRTALQSRYPGKIRMGYTWAEGVFAGKSLVEEARSIMKCERVAMKALPSDEPQENRSQFSGGEVDNFTVFFQPKINMQSGVLIGAEALARGLDEEGRVIPPVKFLESMESSGSVRDLDLYILDYTMHLMDTWREQGLNLVPVSVNFSRVTLFDSAALASVLAIQSRYPLLDPGLIEIEVTESAGNVSQSALNRVMSKFREFGVRFSMDDFGSQYSNLSVFTNVKFDTVKLDRSLVTEVTRNEMSRMLIKDIVRICETGGMTCIAEGVETREQISMLTQAGCIYAQGFYYDRPMPAEDFRIKYLFNSPVGVQEDVRRGEEQYDSKCSK